MKKTTLVALILLATTALTGCKKTIDIREDFVAIYSVTETWTENGKTLSKPIYSMPIYKSSQNSILLLLNNFGNYGIGVTAEATVSGNTITIPQQTLPNSVMIVGSGTLDGTTLSFTYTETSKNVSILISTVARMK